MCAFPGVCQWDVLERGQGVGGHCVLRVVLRGGLRPWPCWCLVAPRSLSLSSTQLLTRMCPESTRLMSRSFLVDSLIAKTPSTRPPRFLPPVPSPVAHYPGLLYAAAAAYPHLYCNVRLAPAPVIRPMPTNPRLLMPQSVTPPAAAPALAITPVKPENSGECKFDLISV